MDPDVELIAEFLAESHEHLDQLGGDLIELEKAPGSRELIASIFRTIHTIKGSCGFLGFSRLEDLTHATEDLLTALHDGDLEATAPVTEVLVSMVDAVRALLRSVEATGSDEPPDLDGVADEPEEALVEVGMQRIGQVWSTMPRMVADLAAQLGRDVDLRMEGEETELDRALLEALRGPLTHLVRNALDHGIELPDDRVAAGKAAPGHLLLRAFHESGQVVVEVCDDGAGIDLEKVVDAAVRRGGVTREQAARMEPREVLDLIFLPGLSTAAEVTHVSGRGVGMDVVRTTIERIGGTVDVHSRVAQGTTCRVRIPLASTRSGPTPSVWSRRSARSPT